MISVVLTFVNCLFKLQSLKIKKKQLEESISNYYFCISAFAKKNTEFNHFNFFDLLKIYFEIQIIYFIFIKKFVL